MRIFSIKLSLENLVIRFLYLLIPPWCLVNHLNKKLLNPFEIIKKRYLSLKKRLTSIHDIS